MVYLITDSHVHTKLAGRTGKYYILMSITLVWNKDVKYIYSMSHISLCAALTKIRYVHSYNCVITIHHLCATTYIIVDHLCAVKHNQKCI